MSSEIELLLQVQDQEEQYSDDSGMPLTKPKARTDETPLPQQGGAGSDIDDGGDSGSTGSSEDPFCACVVCMEPLEWVAVGPCGHRVVCSACAARIRSGPEADKRCCICRTPCAAVIVTKAASAAVVFTFSEMPMASRDRRVGKYWYYAAMSAYFDDRRHYKATKQAVRGFLKTTPPPPSRPGDASENLGVSPRRPGVSWRGHAVRLLVVVVVSALFWGSLAYLTTGGYQERSDRIGIVSGLAALSAVLSALLYCLFSY